MFSSANVQVDNTAAFARAILLIIAPAGSFSTIKTLVVSRGDTLIRLENPEAIVEGAPVEILIIFNFPLPESVTYNESPKE